LGGFGSVQKTTPWISCGAFSWRYEFGRGTGENRLCNLFIYEGVNFAWGRSERNEF
jgi:hypothetical protein